MAFRSGLKLRLANSDSLGEMLTPVCYVQRERWGLDCHILAIMAKWLSDGSRPVDGGIRDFRESVHEADGLG